MNGNIINVNLRVIICCAFFCYFLFAPFKTRFRYSYCRTVILAFLLTLITALIYVLFLTPNQFLIAYSKLGVIIWIVSAVATFHIAIKGSFFEILFIVLVVLNLYVNIVSIAEVILNKLNLHLEIERTLITFVILMVYIPFLCILMFKLYRPVIEFNLKFSFWKFIWVIPALTYMIFFVKIMNDYWRNPIHAECRDIAFIILWFFTTYTFFCVTLWMLIQTYKGITAMKQAHLITSQLKMQENQYERLLDNIDKTERLRHDWKHHLLSINGFVEHGTKEELKNYLKQLLPEYLLREEISVCANHIVDVILQHNLTIAKANGVNMKIKANIQRSISISDTDLCIIFGNLVENAMDACILREDDNKSIEIMADMKDNKFVLLVKNTYNKKVDFKNDMFYSTKHEGVGIGLSSVREVIEKNKGFIKVNYDENFFSVYVLINID